MKRFIQQILGLWFALFAAVATTPAQAQTSYMSDIDIYSTSASSTVLPNVLIILDNTANWSSPFNREMASLYQVINALPANKFRLGLMMFTETGTGNSGTDGGYVRAAMRKLDDATSGGLNYKAKMLALFNTAVAGGIHTTRDRSNAGKAANTMAEAYYYFAQQAPSTGNQKAKTDYASNTELNATTYAASQAVYNMAGNALSSKNATQYQSFPQDACAGNYIIWISNGATQDPNSDNTTASTKLSNAYTALGVTRPADITGLNPTGSQSNVADEWARFMRRSTPQAVTTFTLDIDPVTTGQGPGWSALLASMAVNSNGEYFKITNSAADAGAAIAAALGNIFNQILATNSTFASASLPVSVNARGSYLNQVFMGMFRPDVSAKPRWRGNLKQYKFGYDPQTDTLRLEDTLNAQAISGGTGFVNPSAVSYWTTPSTFFTNDPLGTPPSGSDSADGEVVEKGGAAQRLRTLYAGSQNARRIYTCLSSTCSDLTVSSSTFASTNTALTNALFGLGSDAASTTEKGNVIAWARGTSNVTSDPKDVGPGGTVTVRPSIHGDVLHSRPSVVNYGPTGTNNIVVFYGTNDGMLRAVNGNQTATNGGVAAGEEFWSYVPQEHFSKLKRLRDNTPEVKLSSTAATGTTPRDYFVDGPIGLYQKINSGGTPDKVMLFVGMRRGGRTLYAFDVTNVAVPKLVWKKTNTDTGMSNLGQTWSEPRVAKVRGHANPVVIMGGGYDEPGEDPYTPTSSPTMGNAIYVFDAFDGTKLAEFSTTRAVPADVSLMDADYDGYIDRAYASDVHGNVYRVDLEVTKTCGTPSATCGKTPTDWIIRQVASLSTSTLKRKVFFPPDVVLGGTFAAIMVGTGDREKPLCGQGSTTTPNCATTADGFYTVYDTTGIRPAYDYTRTATAVGDLGTVGTADSQVAGCVIPMSTAGEKIVNAPLTVGGYTYFSTNKPDASANVCTGQLGIAKVYGAKVFCQGAISETRTGGGMPPSPVSGVVSVTYVDPTTQQTINKQVPFVIGGISNPNAADPNTTGTDSGCGLGGCRPVLNISPNRTRKYWFVENPK